MLDDAGLGLTTKVEKVKPSGQKNRGDNLKVVVKQEMDQQFSDHIFPQKIIKEYWPKFEPKFYSLDDISMTTKIPFKVLAMLTSSVSVSLKGVPGFEE